MDRNSNLLNGILWTFTGTGVQVFLKFIVFIVLSRLLEPKSFGIMATALAILAVLSVFSKLGIGPSIVQKKVINSSHIETGYTLSIFFSIILTSLLWIIAPFIAGFFNMYELKSVLRTLAFVHIIQGFSIVSEALLQRDLNFKKLAIVQVTSYLIYGAFGISLSLLGFGVWALVYAYILNVLFNSLLLILMRKHPKKLTFNLLIAKELLTFGSGYSLSSIYNHFALQGDTFVIGKLLGATPLGIFSRSYQLFSIPVNLIGTVIEKVLFPSFSKLQSNIKELKEIYKSAIVLTGLICLPGSLLLFILAEEIISLLFGIKWYEAILPFKILILGLLPRTSYKISDSLTKSQGKVYQSANRQFVYGILIIIGVSIGQFYGLVGASIGVLIAITVNYIYMSKIALSLSDFGWKDFVIFHIPSIKLTIISVVPTIVVYKVSKLLIENNFVLITLISMEFILIILISLHTFPKFILGKSNKMVFNLIKRISFITL